MYNVYASLVTKSNSDVSVMVSICVAKTPSEKHAMQSRCDNTSMQRLYWCHRCVFWYCTHRACNHIT